MKRSKSMVGRDNTACLYVRLSRDDNLDGDSYSIQNQKKMLAKAAKEKGYTNLLTFTDDGVSGVTMKRPGFQNMMEALSRNEASAVFVKDMSRLGRNYIEVGKLTEYFFPENGIRLVAVSDGVDTDEGENELTPIRNLFNEWYARDISKKRRMSNKTKGNAGEPLSQPPYGYMKNPDDPKHWLIDEEAAHIVRRIYRMCLDGQGISQIASALTDDRIPTPTFYWLSKGIRRSGKIPDKRPYEWGHSTVDKILTVQEYCGDIINFKTYSMSFKSKRRIENDDKLVFEGVNTPIIERPLWELVQQMRSKGRKRRTNEGEKSMFSGLLVCADCGQNLWYHFSQSNRGIKYFSCSNYKGNRGSCETTHYIRLDFLEMVVLGEIRRLTRFASHYEDEFARAVTGIAEKAMAADRQAKEKMLEKMLARDNELDTLFERLYEDKTSGLLSEDRFIKMSRRYEDEQASLQANIKALGNEIDAIRIKASTTENFIAAVRKFTRARKLTQRMLYEMVERIEVHHAEIVDGEKVQRIKIHYNCIGSIEIPDNLPLPEPEVCIETRKGVAISNSIPQLAI